MNNISCQKCGGEISNDFGVTLAYCTNCGASLSNLSNEETLSFENTLPLQPSPVKRQFSTIFLTILLTAFFLFILFAAGLYFYLPQVLGGSADGAAKPLEAPAPRSKLPSTVSAVEVSKITYSTWQHYGLLSSGDGYVQSYQTTFSRDGSATQTRSKNYDDGQRAAEKVNFNSSITAEQFNQLAEVMVDNDFFNESDSLERISEGDATLTVIHSGGEKIVKTSNTGNDTPEIKTILQAFNNLQRQISWKPL